jgi:hypothetical protein
MSPIFECIKINILKLVTNIDLSNLFYKDMSIQGTFTDGESSVELTSSLR